MTGKEIPSVEKLYMTILKRSSLPLPGFEEGLRENARSRAGKIHDYLLERADRLYDEKCLMCGKIARKSQTRHAYETPWQDRPVVKYFCSDDCGDSCMYEEPFAYFWCDSCDREICEQNPANGWHIQYGEYGGNKVCLRCYQDAILENGMERKQLEAGRIPGMFFSPGKTEALDRGFRELPGFANVLIESRESADKFRLKALELMDHGYRVVIGYERMAIDGSEGRVTLMAKR